MEAENKGKTIWEMLMERVRGSGNGAGISFRNPLELQVGSALNIAHSNGPEYADYDFSVQEIREYTRHIGGKDFSFTDYVLRGVNKNSFAAGDALTARVRVVPNDSGAYDSLLLRIYDEFAFAQDFLEVVKDATGVFEVTDEASGAAEEFHRINEVRDSYEAAVLVISSTTADGKGSAGKAEAVKLEYWDYWRDVEVEGVNTKEFIFVEMNSDSGWFQIWRGREFYR
jgi:hypothetical protein